MTRCDFYGKFGYYAGHAGIDRNRSRHHKRRGLRYGDDWGGDLEEDLVRRQLDAIGVIVKGLRENLDRTAASCASGTLQGCKIWGWLPYYWHHRHPPTLTVNTTTVQTTTATSTRDASGVGLKAWYMPPPVRHTSSTYICGGGDSSINKSKQMSSRKRKERE